MKEIRCARHGGLFEPEAEYHILCPDCWSEVGLYGDSESLKFWRTASQWANGNWTQEELKELADSAIGQEILQDLLDAMDIGMKLKLFNQEVRKMQ